MIVSGYLAMTLFFRTVGCLCPDFDYAMKFAAVIIVRFRKISKVICSTH
jgi:ATP-binding cassette subfamily G (WHITE) protein 2 (SNQ2)